MMIFPLKVSDLMAITSNSQQSGVGSIAQEVNRWQRRPIRNRH